MIEGFGVHTFRFVNADGKGTFVKFHWRPRLGLQSTVWDEAVKLAGADPDFHRRDLHEAIASGSFPEWDFGIQSFDDAFAAKLPFDVLDSTKLIPEEILPLRLIGKMTLNRNPDNFFAETEQVAFLPSNVPPGIDFSNDPLLQGRLFSYLDTQKSRLGTTNFHQIPINAPKCPFANMQRDGMMQMTQPKGRANYEPNSLHLNGEIAGPRAMDDGFKTFPANAERNNPGEKLRVRSESFADHFSQARMFYKSQTEIEQAHIASAITFELSKVTLPHIQDRVVGQLRNLNQDLAERVAKGVGIALPPAVAPAKPPQDMAVSPALSIVKNMKNSPKCRKLGILFSDGSDAAAIKSLKAAAEKAGMSVALIAPRLKNIKTKGGTMDADGQLAGTPSCTVDAIALILTEKAAQDLCGEGAAVQFVSDAFAHLKAIGYSSTSKSLIHKAGVQPDSGIFDIGGALIKAAGTRFYDREAKVRHLA